MMIVLSLLWETFGSSAEYHLVRIEGASYRISYFVSVAV